LHRARERGFGTRSTEGADVSEPVDLRLRVLGSIFTVRCADVAVRDLLAADWSRCLAPSGPPSADPVGFPAYTQEAAYLLASHLTTRAIEDLAGGYVMLHAAGLATDSGRVIALVAASGTGKTTAAEALSRSGLGYVTDETVAVAQDGSVLPFPKPLSMVEPARPFGRKTQAGPDARGLTHAPAQLLLRRIVLLDRVDAMRGGPTLTPVPLSQALVDLVPQTSALPRLNRPIEALCRLIDRCGSVFRLSYTEIGEALPLIHQLVESETIVEERWQRAAPRLPHEHDMQWALLDGRVRRRPISDAVQVGEEGVFMADSMISRLSPLGLLIWQALDTSTTPDDLLTQARKTFGDHPDASELVPAAIQALVTAKILGLGQPKSVTEALGLDSVR
jgi:hypothetical protein